VSVGAKSQDGGHTPREWIRSLRRGAGARR